MSNEYHGYFQMTTETTQEKTFSDNKTNTHDATPQETGNSYFSSSIGTSSSKMVALFCFPVTQSAQSVSRQQ